MSTQFISIGPIDRTLSGATTPGQSRPGRDDSQGVFCIPQSSSITGTSPLDCFLIYLRVFLRAYYAEGQSECSAAPADKKINNIE